MRYKDLFRSIENPLTEEILNEILDGYCERGTIYNTLIKTDLSKKVTQKYYISARDRLKVYFFNEWKKSIHKIIERNRIRPEWENRIKKLDAYLQTKNPTTAKEVREILYPTNLVDKELEDALEKVSWESVGEYSSWDHIDSSAVYVGLHSRKSIEHRLYVNCDSTAIDIIAYELAKRCKSEKLRYYFKYDIYASRSDTLVIYCATEDILKFRRILNNIIKDNRLEHAIHKPPILTGVIDGWIGYGTEPEDINGERQSFNSKREKHLESCIKKSTAMWIRNNLGFKIKLNGNITTYGQYFLAHMTASIKEKMLRYVSSNPNEVGPYGYSKNDVLSKEFDQVIKATIKNNFGKIMAYLKGEIKRLDLTIKIRGKIVYIPRVAIEESIKNQTKTIRKISEKYTPNLLRMIKQTSKEWGISEQNYAFDIKGLERFAIEDYVENASKENTPPQVKKK